ncbi:MAG: pirin family protein [Hormoscilla sp. GM7CHS1pb]|nr:pirin family protein [Hormoscilla sp. GM7CHS1pb]
MSNATLNQKHLAIRKGTERGQADRGWLKSYHTFSFANYYDRNYMGFRDLRVINEDRVQPGNGFGTHPHRDMEILSYVLEGALEHKDSMGNGSVIEPGDAQIVSAGTGITHSEYNHSDRELVHFLQIWVQPNVTGLSPRYEQKFFPEESKLNQLRLIVSTDGRDGSITIHQDVNIYASLLEAGRDIVYQGKPDRYVWVQVARGKMMLDDELLEAGDGAAVSAAESLQLVSKEKAEFLLFDLA